MSEYDKSGVRVMGEMKHTPGPWEVRYPADISEGLYWVFPEATTIEEDDANARLIAAAPEMKEALLMLRDYVLDTVDGHSTANPDVRQQAREDLIALDRVLRKVNGETQKMENEK